MLYLMLLLDCLLLGQVGTAKVISVHMTAHNSHLCTVGGDGWFGCLFICFILVKMVWLLTYLLTVMQVASSYSVPRMNITDS
jgi:hypothetical protein